MGQKRAALETKTEHQQIIEHDHNHKKPILLLRAAKAVFLFSLIFPLATPRIDMESEEF